MDFLVLSTAASDYAKVSGKPFVFSHFRLFLNFFIAGELGFLAACQIE
jgi:hypothetical protein